MEAPSSTGPARGTLALLLCGDVMTGRGIDQILPQPASPELFEPVVRSAQTYVELAESSTGPIPRGVDASYVWGDALETFGRAEVRIVNLETAVTSDGEPWPGKAIHYRMHPANTPCLTAAGIDCCVLANNHVLDWGRSGLLDTLEALRAAGLRTAGAGRDAAEAASPAVIGVGEAGRVLVFAFGSPSSGVPRSWAAGEARAGLNLLDDLSEPAAEAVARRIGAARRPGDIVVVSIHWGGNWGFEIPTEQRRFAERLIDAAAVDVVHGHSSHHVKGIEVYRDRPILYGCGDFLNDYEGIRGYEAFRGDVGAIHLATLEAGSGRLVELVLAPTRIRRFRVGRAPPEDAHWLREVLDREGRALGTRAEPGPDGMLRIRWD